MSFFIDIILIAIILIAVLTGWRRGFVRSFMRLVSFAVALVATWLLYNPLSQFLYDKLFLGGVTGYIQGAFDRDVGSTGTSIANLFSELPDFFTGFLNRFSSTNEVAKYYAENTKATSSDISSFMAQPIAQTISKVVAFIGLFLIIYIVLKLVTALLDRVVRLPLLNGVNKVLGIVLGALLGLFLAWIAAIAFNALLPQLAKLYPAVFKANVVDQTMIMRFLYNFNLFKLVDMFKL